MVQNVVRIRFEGDQMGPKFQKNMTKASGQVTRSLVGAANDYSQEFLKAGRADMAGAGNFSSSRWQQGLLAPVTRGGGNILISIGHRVPYWIVFQEGRVIQGRPLLWIPLSFARDAVGVSARNYPGKLFRVDRGGGRAPLLLSAQTGQPKYFGKTSVRIPKKFKVLEIARTLSRKISVFYKARMARERKG